MHETADINLDELRQKLALKHGLVLGRDDPVLALLTLNDELLRHFVRLVDRGTEAASIHMAAAMAAGTEEAIKRSERIAADVIGAATELAAGEIQRAGHDAAKSVDGRMTDLLNRIHVEADQLRGLADGARVSVNRALIIVAAVCSLATGLGLGKLL